MSEQHFDLNLLRMLHVLLDTRNMTRTAEMLGTTQSAVSRHLAKARISIGDPLLVREGHTYLLTPRAQQLQSRLKDMLPQLENLLEPDLFNPASCQREFVFASSDYIAEYMLPELVAAITPQAPLLKINYLLWQPGQYQVLYQDQVDVITTISDTIPANLHGKKLGEDQPVCLMRADHPLASQALTLDDYVKTPHVRITGGSDKDGRIDAQLQRQGLQRHFQVQVPFYTAALNIAAQSDMLLTVPQHIAINFARHHPVIWQPIPLQGLPNYQYWLLWHEKNHHDAGHQWFRNQVFVIINYSIHGIGHYLETQPGH
ncbi:LysR family transcriptional regulator [Leeia oryzae]|uniref:LysR family transcriptional regulator n=1 Tax=Leeia oryzae TaxID=356662 RepID=UPI00035C8657|nr:LysR family transcriptional regulator [Leeia oryzae]